MYDSNRNSIQIILKDDKVCLLLYTFVQSLQKFNVQVFTQVSNKCGI